MTNVIAFMHKKGGVGKSTLSRIIATEFSALGVTKLIDLDSKMQSIARFRKKDLEQIKEYAAKHPKSNLADFYKRTNEGKRIYPIVDLAENRVEDLGNIIKKSSELGYKYIFIDSPGAVAEKGFLETVKYVNHIIIPMLDDEDNKVPTAEFYHWVREQMESGRLSNIKSVHCLVNNYDDSEKRFTGLMNFIKENKLKMLSSIIKRKASLRYAEYTTIFPLSQYPENEIIGEVVKEIQHIITKK